MFKGHVENMQRLAAAGKLVSAGPLDGVDGWRGMFIFAVPEIDEAKALAATDPVIRSGEMIAEYHKLFSSAALMLVNDTREDSERIFLTFRKSPTGIRRSVRSRDPPQPGRSMFYHRRTPWRARVKP
jgi:hypothetical protein